MTSAKKMTHRQRVTCALSHQEPDIVPTAICGGSYGIVDDLYLRLVDYLHLGERVAPFRSGHNISYMDDRLLEKLGTDIRYCWPAQLPNSPSVPGKDSESYYDHYGQVWKRAYPYYFTGEPILKDARQVDDIDRLIHWPVSTDLPWMAGVAERAQLLREQTDYFIAMRMVASHGPFQTACDLRGTYAFILDLARNPEFASTLLERITAVLEGLIQSAMQAGGKYFDMIELPGDDYAANNNLILSPAMFRKFISPCLIRLIDAVRENNPDTKIMLHSDGAITKLLDEIINLGVDVIHPLEPLPATDLPSVKGKYGERVTFLGGIDISHAMPGRQEDVIADVKRRIAQLAAGGGYILAPSNHLQADVPVENVVTLFRSAHEFGRYPIRGEAD